MPFRDIIEVQKILAKSNICQTEVILDENESEPPQTLYCHRKWPKLIYRIKNMIALIINLLSHLRFACKTTKKRGCFGR